MTDDPKKFSMFYTLTKVDEEKRLVYGRATEEIPDGVREICDIRKSTPYFRKWSDAAEKRSGGKSKGNMREMHEPIAAGKVIDIEFGKNYIDIGTYCSNDSTWGKILDGTLTGFSVGGNYVERYPDPNNPSLIRYVANPQEISYVDSPAVPTATYKLIKRDGSQELRKAISQNFADQATIDGQQFFRKRNTNLWKTRAEFEKDLPAGAGMPAELVGQNDAADVWLANEEDQPEDPALERVQAGQEVKNVPSVAGGFLSPEIINANRAVKEISSPVDNPVEKILEQINSLVSTFSVSVDKLDTMRQDYQKEQTEKLKKLKEFGGRVGIARREGSPVTPPTGFPNDLNQYGDPANFDWPLDTPARVQSAKADFNNGVKKALYPVSAWHVLGHRIALKASEVLRTNHDYAAREMKIKEVKKMADLNKVDLLPLLQQVSSALGVAADQIAKDPSAARDMLLALVGNIDSATTTESASTGTVSTPPTGEQANADVTQLKAAAPSSLGGSDPAAAGGSGMTSVPSSPSSPSATDTPGVTTTTIANAVPTNLPKAATPTNTIASPATMTPKADATATTPPSSPSSPSSSPSSPSAPDAYKEALDKVMAENAEIKALLGKLTEHLTGKAPVDKAAGLPVNFLDALITNKQPEPSEVIKILGSGEKDALVKAAQKLGSQERPDLEGLYKEVQDEAFKSLTEGMVFTKFYAGMRGGLFMPPPPDEAKK